MTNKPKGGSGSPLTQLKQLAAAKQEVIWGWRAEAPALTNAQIRERIATEYGVRLARDGQLSQFWAWYSARLDLTVTNDLLETFEEFCRTENPGWSDEQVRSTGIKFFMAHSVALKDAEKFAAIVTLDQRERKATLDERRLNLDVHKFQFDAAQAALACLAELNAIKRDGSLSEDAKLEQARLKLFGELPK